MCIRDRDHTWSVKTSSSTTISSSPSKLRAQTEPLTINSQVDAVSIGHDDSGDESQDEAMTAMLDDAATRYYESIVTESENSDDSEAVSTIHDIGNDTQFAFESQEPEDGARKNHINQTNQEYSKTNGGRGRGNDFQLSINKMDLYLFLTVFTAMMILTLACLLYTSPSPRD